MIEHYIHSGKPVGSNTLKEAGFDNLSSATIRNYFAELEEQGYLQQQHVSGGRIPTQAAFRLYAESVRDSKELADYEHKALSDLRLNETRQIAAFLQEGAESLSKLSGCAVFMSAPRFDQDYIAVVKVVPLQQRCAVILLTDFGVVQSEIFTLEKKLSAHDAKHIEEYFNWRLTGHDEPVNLSEHLEELSKMLYNEMLMRYAIKYSTFTDEDVYRTGFSKLLAFPEFHDASLLAHSLAIFENAHTVRLLLRECTKLNHARFWIGEDLNAYSTTKPACAIIAMPYHINTQAVGAIGILGPIRMPYRTLFGLARAFSESISEALTRNVYKFKIGFRQPSTGIFNLEQTGQALLAAAPLMLIENKTVEIGEIS